MRLRGEGQLGRQGGLAAARRPDDQRQGTPEQAPTQHQIQVHKDRIFARAADDNDSMPLGPHGPSGDERHQLGDWLACGAP